MPQALKPQALNPQAMKPQALPQIFDRALLQQRLSRAAQSGPADFLLERAARDMLERVSAVRREFLRRLDIGTPGPHVAAGLAGLPFARLVRALPHGALNSDGPWESIAGDHEAVPFAPASFDLVTSALSLQFVNDLPGALVQIRRTLAPDGLFLGCLAGGQTLYELRTVLAEAEEAVTGGASPRVAPFADLRDMGALLQRAGFALPVTDTDIVTVRYKNLTALAHDLRAMGATNALTQRSRRPLRRAVWRRAAEIYARNFSDPDGRIRATFEFIWLSGWAAHDSQQKPLPPGSAKMRLADALGVREGKLPT